VRKRTFMDYEGAALNLDLDKGEKKQAARMLQVAHLLGTMAAYTNKRVPVLPFIDHVGWK
jgi:hypothetical protein